VTQQRTYDFRRGHYAGAEGRLIPLLQEAQARDGFLSRERLYEIHEESGVPLAQIYGVATFYAQFRFTPVGRNMVKVCHGTACHVSGAKEITEAVEDTLGIATGETTDDRLFSLEMVSCLGCCSLAPVVMVNETTHGNLTDREVRKLLKAKRAADAGAAHGGAGAADGAGDGAAPGGAADAAAKSNGEEAR
jgi:NADH-quinone oxidoreductase subunit E